MSDEAILGAAVKALIDRGPALTLAEVGAEVGLSAATIVQRFGSKRDLMLAVARGWPDAASRQFDGEGSVVERIATGLTSMVNETLTPERIANLIASMNIDLIDLEFREIIAEGFVVQRQAIDKALREGIAAEELRQCDTEGLARVLQIVAHGALQIWATNAEGELREFMLDCLETTIEPWRISEEAEEEAA